VSDKEQQPESSASPEMSHLREVITLLKQQVDSTKANEDQLLRTVKYTGETNSKIMEVMTSQNKHNKIKLVLFTLPVIFILISFGMKAYNESSKYDSDHGYVAQVKITGAIAAGSKTASADAVIPSLRAAFADENAKGILIRVSSPGGSPTQSHLIYDEIKRLQEVYPERDVALIGEDMLTSGAMWIASAVKNIAVMETTYVGSIGVIVSTFDFSKVAERFEINRLVITSGKSKSQLDQFLPPKEKDIAKIKGVANQIHEKFIEVVTESRGDRLNGDPDFLFSGDYWLGQKAVELGLVDQVTTTSRLLIEQFGTENVRDYSSRPGFLDGIKLGNLVSILLGELPLDAVNQSISTQYLTPPEAMVIEQNLVAQ